MATTARRPGRPLSLSKAARGLLRDRGPAWLAEARRQADLGSLEAIELILKAASLPAEPSPSRSRAPTT